jgi:glutamine synthetase
MALSCATAKDVLKTIKDEKVQMIDLRFADLPGVWQHFSVPPSAVGADAFEAGIGFDGSSIRGFQEIQESDMLVVPDPTTAFLDPFTTATTLVLICNVRDPVTGQTYSRDARYVAQKAETYLKSTGLGGCETEIIMAMPRNLQRRPAKPALGNGRIQRAVRRAFYFGFEVTSSEVYDWVYPRCRPLLTQGHRHSARRVLMTMADPIRRVPPHGAWLWRLRNSEET